MKLVLALLRIFLGVFFILSGALKLFPVEPFELSFISMGVAAWNSAPLIARAVIGIEWVLGLFFIINFRMKKVTLPASLALLIIFTGYLLFELMVQGNTGNCGCFGIYFQMSPAESLLKNGGLIAMIILLWKIGSDAKYRFQKTIAISGLVVSLLLPFILNPPDFIARKNLQPETVNFPLDRNKILKENKFGAPPIDLFKGKHVIAFMTLTCPHCRQAAMKIHVINKRYPEISFFIFINGKDENLDDFFISTNSKDIPHIKMNAEPFASLTGGSWPAIWWIENGVVVKKSSYFSLNEEELIAWNNHP
ncbi:MAG: DoxX family protein [Chitinophagales bacterium]|nr:DoxX family protein [Chitinophagales bacterium]